MTTSSPQAILPPPRLSGFGTEDINNQNRWLFGLYQSLVVTQRLDARLTAIAAITPQPTNISGTVTAAQINATNTAINAIIAAAARST